MGKKIIAMMIFLSSTVTFGHQNSWEIQQRFDRENEYLDLKIRESKCYVVEPTARTVYSQFAGHIQVIPVIK